MAALDLEEHVGDGKPGYSTMAHKRNPALCENIVTVGTSFRHDAAFIHEAMQQLERLMFELPGRLGKQGAREQVVAASVHGMAHGLTLAQLLLSMPAVAAGMSGDALATLLYPTTCVVASIADCRPGAGTDAVFRRARKVRESSDRDTVRRQFHRRLSGATIPREQAVSMHPGGTVLAPFLPVSGGDPEGE